MITCEFPPNPVGGIGTYVKNLASNLAQLGCKILIISNKVDKQASRNAPDVEFINVPRYGPGIIGISMFYFYAMQRVKKVLQKRIKK